MYNYDYFFVCGMCVCVCVCIMYYAVYALLKVHCHSFHKTSVIAITKLESCSLFMFVLRILQGCALIGIMFLALIVLLHVVTYRVPLMLFVYIVCICCLLIV